MGKWYKFQQFQMIIFLITLVFSFTLMFVYLHKGQSFASFDQHFLPAKFFGVPQDLKDKGIKVFYQEKNQCGWDGQFYYYISNDLLGIKDTAQHIDSPAYRYQRIGLPMLAKILSLLTFHTWVNPLTYYLTSLFLILMASLVSASYFREKNISPYWILIWSLGVGTQLTLLNGLPDAAADSLFILSLIALMHRKYGYYVIAATFAALSREILILVPSFICLFYFILAIKTNRRFFPTLLNKKIWFLGIPLIVFFLWQCYIRWHFGSPNIQATGILGWPFQSAWDYMLSGFQNHHLLVGPGGNSYKEAWGIVFFIGILSVSFVPLLFVLKTIFSSFNSVNEKNVDLVGVYVGLMSIILVYFCFGNTVMMHYTGYMKAGNLFFFVFFFLVAINKNAFFARDKWFYSVAFFLLMANVFFTLYLLRERVIGHPYPAPYITKNVQYAQEEPLCLKDYAIQVIPVSIEQPFENTFINQVLMPRDLAVYVKATNNGDEPFSPFNGKGGVNISYQWVMADTPTIIAMDGERTVLPYTLQPGQSVVLPLWVHFPRKSGKYTLKLTAVQEGCGWFYMKNSHSSTDIRYDIR